MEPCNKEVESSKLKCRDKRSERASLAGHFDTRFPREQDKLRANDNTESESMRTIYPGYFPLPYTLCSPDNFWSLTVWEEARTI